MNAQDYQPRRATLDDLPSLRVLWENSGLDTTVLERRFTEFQVVSLRGVVIACVGLQILSQQGRLHSEAFARADLRDRWKDPLWERLLSVARKHGLIRLWIQSDDAFWKSKGFQPVALEDLDPLPAEFKESGRPWLAFQLREAGAKAISIEHEMEAFQQGQRWLSERALRQARWVRWIALIISIISLVLVLLAMWYVLRRLPPAKPRAAILILGELGRANRPR